MGNLRYRLGISRGSQGADWMVHGKYDFKIRGLLLGTLKLLSPPAVHVLN
jgi:hypothetical protein